MNNIWEKLHPLGREETRSNLGDYRAITTNDQVIATSEEELKEAQRVIKSLNMAPSPGANAATSRRF